MARSWWHIQILCDPALEDLIFWRLDRFGCRGIAREVKGLAYLIHTYLPQPQAHVLDLAALAIWLRQDAITVELPPPQAQWHLIDEEDWASSWKQYWQPVEVGDYFLICPAWITPPTTVSSAPANLSPANPSSDRLSSDKSSSDKSSSTSLSPANSSSTSASSTSLSSANSSSTSLPSTSPSSGSLFPSPSNHHASPHAPPQPRLVLKLDPGAAFGTGTHPTTQLCLEALEMRFGDNPKDLMIADIGCGSGILSIGAVKLGAKQVYAVDVDAVAVRSTRSNRDLNGIHRQQLVVGLGSVEQLAALADRSIYFDGILCNILAEVILDLIPQMTAIAKPQAWAILSGILLDQAKPIADRLEQHGWNVATLWRRKEWCCFNIRRT